MMRPALLWAAALLAASTPASAAETPRAGGSDPRIRNVDYRPDQVVRLVGALRTATQVLFAPDETILHVALGDTAAWEVAPEGDSLFLKPTSLRPPTNLIVTTRAPGRLRHYRFELSARGDASRRGGTAPAFVVQFRYPQDDAARLRQALSAEERALSARILQLKLDRGVLEGPRNLAYELRGSTALAPSEVTDNGRFTVLRFPGGQPLPAVYVVGADGAEGLAPFDVRGEFLVVHRVAAQLRLRRGREVLCILNTAYRPAGAATGTATAARDVVRTLPGDPAP